MTTSKGVRALARTAGFCLLCTALAALAQSVTEQARELLRKGQPQAAFNLLEPRADEFTDAETAYLLGIAALDIGKAGLAVIAFERALAYDPAYAIARAELVRALIETGETDEARRHLARLLDVNADVPPQVKPKLLGLQQQLAAVSDVAQRRTSGVSWYIEGETGYDSNINTGANSASFPVPLFGGASVTLASVFQKHDSMFVGGATGFQAYKELQPGLRVFGGLDGRVRYDLRQFDNGDYYTSLWSASAGARWQRGVHTFSGAATYLENRVVNDMFDRSKGFYGQWQMQLDQFNEVGLFGQYQDQQHPINRALDTTLVLAGAGWRHGFDWAGSPVLSLAAYYGDDNERGPDPAVGRRITGARAGYEQRLPIGARLITSIARQTSVYGGQNLFFLRVREDVRTDFSVGLAFSPAKDVTLTPQYILTRNASNIPVTDFTRHQLLITIRRDFY